MYRRKPASLLKHLISLRVALSTAPLQFVIDFLELSGTERIEAIMVKLAALPQEKGDMIEQVVGETLKCLRTLMNVDVSRTLRGQPAASLFPDESELMSHRLASATSWTDRF